MVNERLAEESLYDYAHESPSLVTEVPGPRSVEATRRQADLECPAFAHRRAERARRVSLDLEPIVLTRAAGSCVWDVDGNRYIDLVCGFGAAILGHAPLAVERAAAEQAARLPTGLGDVYPSDVKLALLERLATLRPGADDRVLFAQSGADAVTAALKTACLATGRPGVVAFEGGYHGLGFAPLAATSLSASFRAPFAAQLNPHVRFVPFPSDAASGDAALEALRRALSAGDVGAVLIEPVLGRGGCVVPPDGVLAEIFRVARAAGALAVADEVWTGMGRSGALLRTEALGARADVVAVGKALGGGWPIAACLAPSPVMEAWARPGRETIHTSTHVGSPPACAAALATWSELHRVGGCAKALSLGERARAVLTAELPECEARGVGAIVGLRLPNAGAALGTMQRLLRRGYLALTGGVAGDVLTLTPPLTLAPATLDGALEAVIECARDSLSQAGA